MDYATLEHMRLNHPAWRLLCSPHAALVGSFLQRVFITPNVRAMRQSQLVLALDDDLFGLRERLGLAAFPKLALEYLNDWAANDKAWLRKFYKTDSDEPYFDLTPAAERAIAWLATLTQRSFVGTQSRLLTLMDLLKQIGQGSQSDPQVRVAQLQQRRDEIDAEMARVLSGDMPLLDDTAVKDRFQQFTALARELLGDFREVEHNFRVLDRQVRERIALWDGTKGALLQQVLGERDAIDDSDQGRSFRAFWDFLMSQSRKDELTALLHQVLDLPPVVQLNPDERLRRVHYDWLQAGDSAQRTVAQLSQQLRRFLDDRALLENRRIMEILRGIEAKALALRELPPIGTVMHVADTMAQIELPMERPLYAQKTRTVIARLVLEEGDDAVDATALFSQWAVDKLALAGYVNHALQTQQQISLGELCQQHPLQHGLAELVAYLELASDRFSAQVDDEVTEFVAWRGLGQDGKVQQRQARLPRVIFVR